MVQGKRGKYIYNSILCRIFIGLLCREVILRAGHAQRSLPCDHSTSSCTDDPWLIVFVPAFVFFMSSAFFAINAFVLKETSCLCRFSCFSRVTVDWKSSVNGDARQTRHLCGPLRVYSRPVEDLSGEPVVFQSNFNRLCQTGAARYL